MAKCWRPPTVLCMALCLRCRVMQRGRRRAWEESPFKATAGLVREVIRYGVDAGDEQEADARQEERVGCSEMGDGAGRHVRACRVRDDDDAGLQGGGERKACVRVCESV